jgi:hypothetical protein
MPASETELRVNELLREHLTAQKSSSSSIDLLQKKHQMAIALIRDQFSIRESSLTRDLQILETRALAAEQEAEEARASLLEQQQESAKSKASANQFQTDLIQSDFRYTTLLQKLFSTFECATIDEVLNCAEAYRIQKARIETLQKNLLDAQLQLSAETLKRTDFSLSPDAIALHRSEEQVKALERTVQSQQESIAGLEAARRALPFLKKPAIFVNCSLISENYAFKSNTSDKRLQVLSYISGRLDPACLSLDQSSPLHAMFESLCLLLKSVGDLDVESDVIVECLAKLSEDAGAAVGGAPRAADADGGPCGGVGKLAPQAGGAGGRTGGAAQR